MGWKHDVGFSFFSAVNNLSGGIFRLQKRAQSHRLEALEHASVDDIRTDTGDGDSFVPEFLEFPAQGFGKTNFGEFTGGICRKHRHADQTAGGGDIDPATGGGFSSGHPGQ